MANENQKHNWQRSERDALDRELDASLAKYAAGEPRTGLEERVLANLRADRGNAPERSWRRWSVVSALALATVVIVVTLAWRTSTHHAPVMANHPSIVAPSVQQPGQRLASNGTEDNAHPPALRPTTRLILRHVHATAVADAHPKLDQFPSPQPLSEQEKILASYVEEYPERAVLLARARTEALRRDLLEDMRAFPSNTRATDSGEPDNGTTER